MKLNLFKFLLLLIAIFFITSADAQCVMCKATSESAQGNEHLIEGLNYGILYLMAIPYILLISIGFIFFRKQIVEKFKSLKKV